MDDNIGHVINDTLAAHNVNGNCRSLKDSIEKNYREREHLLNECSLYLEKSIREVKEKITISNDELDLESQLNSLESKVT